MNPLPIAGTNAANVNMPSRTSNTPLHAEPPRDGAVVDDRRSGAIGAGGVERAGVVINPRSASPFSTGRWPSPGTGTGASKTRGRPASPRSNPGRTRFPPGHRDASASRGGRELGAEVVEGRVAVAVEDEAG